MAVVDLEAQQTSRPAELEVPPEPSGTEHPAGLEPEAVEQTEQTEQSLLSTVQHVRDTEPAAHMAATSQPSEV